MLALASGLLLGASWFPPFTCLIFVAWVPLLALEERFAQARGIRRRKLKLTGLSFLTFFIWNIADTWWVTYASFGGACLAFIGNSLLMCAVFMIFHNTRVRIHKTWAPWLLIPLWLAWEYGHTLWDLSWTWLTLGNAFAFSHNWVQWYEYTGVAGGSLWVLVVNLSLYTAWTQNRSKPAAYAPALLAILLPVVLSYTILHYASADAAGGKPRHIVIVQPNIDPYNEKFYVEPDIQLRSVLKQVQGSIDSATDYLVLPETFITENLWENEIDSAFSIKFLRETLTRRFPRLNIITGASTLKLYQPGETPSATARRLSDDSRFYDAFNTAIQIDSTPHIQLYHKSKLVPGVERMPFPALLKPLESLAINMGGTMGSLGTQDTRTVFFNKDHSVGVAPVICYESVYGDYITGYVRNGANLIFIITNDGWWEDTPGYIQHLNYARLRAIETRCPIARSANTGVSCFIDRTGNILQPTRWWEPAIIKGELAPNTTRTFYARFGDLLSGAAVVMALLTVAFGQFLRFKKS